MRIAVFRESAPNERRVGLTPESSGRLSKAGHEVVVSKDAGIRAGFSDEAYTAARATIAPSDADAARGAQVVVKIRKPTIEELASIPEGTTLVSLLAPGSSGDLYDAMAKRRITGLALELVPRITRAQSMDVLSSQATVAGYKAVLIGAAMLNKFMPMLTTAAGSVAPARVFVLGAGVAGLQAIATARRLGAIVSAFDVRAAVKEQVQSLGAAFVAADSAGYDAEAAGGYAKALGEKEQQRAVDAVAAHIKDVDLVVTTAQIPGRRAPLMVTEAMLRTMRPGSVVVDLAAESGGNCAVTKPDESVDFNGVTVLGPTSLASTLPYHASQMYSRNVEALLKYLVKDGALNIDLTDTVTSPMAVTAGGEVRYGKV
jgi:H+-translocating NAD(P) transhydrogenase subunit alpha